MQQKEKIKLYPKSRKDPAADCGEFKLNTIAIIREAECIGCAKCLSACPVDAILGSNGLMHTVIAVDCIGCKLCLPPCPVDCIEMIPFPNFLELPKREERKKKAMTQFHARKKRLEKENELNEISQQKISLIDKKNYIEEALARAKTKK